MGPQRSVAFIELQVSIFLEELCKETILHVGLVKLLRLVGSRPVWGQIETTLCGSYAQGRARALLTALCGNSVVGVV